ncbi:hypothetical protein IV38_GL000673 [Lactobacillus selangorensis]|uniref:Aspartyl/glutamyl-tRNA(Asn/Gln) amidotransferase subunit C n=1 Tax=Lactobacillus selangorensis TaxID=81857 RepID=A0A0R2FRQ4_9LACO|nr:Asp-tRNA(Asn)/Glu-tRNA(Gln) amidotransferase subunit GatC [Lactobacillus selangorensis]KRN27268.1 hypothetical protein IV38_GL000673 [Lactobacillus selangorensis]KRN29949.1 hypothetical protein IV40_GL000548 [Lactobacillus selangorensis]
MIEKKQVEHVAELAKLSFSDAELDHFTSQLDEIMKMVDQLDEVDTTGVEPTTHVGDLVNVFRKDEAKPGTPRKELMENVPEEQDGLIKVPAIIDEGEDE